MAAELDGLDVGALRRLLDRQEIEDCIVRTTRGADRLDWELFRSAYHADVSEDHGAYIGGLDGLVKFIGMAMSPFAGTQRHVSNFSVDIDGDEAHVESYYLITLRLQDTGTLMLSGGRYLDRLERRDGQWRIATRVVIGEWTANIEGANFPTGDGSDPMSFIPASRDRKDPSYQRPLKVTRGDRSPSRG